MNALVPLQTIGYKSPNPVVVSDRLPTRFANTIPAAPNVSAPLRSTLFRPYKPIMLTANCPPSTGVAKVYVGASSNRSACAFRFKFKLTFMFGVNLPIWISLAAATLPPPLTEV